MTTKSSLGKTDWIKAGFRALTKGGPQAIKAEPISRDLHVSKGSFYWHFKDVSALKKAMLDHWMNAATQDIINAVDNSALPPQDQLRMLVQISTSELDAGYGGPMAEAAIRDWARYDQVAAKALIEVDQKRLCYVELLFRQTNIDPSQAKSISAILYGALIGLQQLAHHQLVNQQEDLMALLEHLLKTKSS